MLSSLKMTSDPIRDRRLEFEFWREMEAAVLFFLVELALAVCINGNTWLNHGGGSKQQRLEYGAERGF